MAITKQIPAGTLAAQTAPYAVGPYALPSGAYSFALHVVGSQAAGGTFDIAIEAADSGGTWDTVAAVYGAEFADDGTWDASWGFYLGSPDAPTPDTGRWAGSANVRARVWVHDQSLVIGTGGTLVVR